MNYKDLPFYWINRLGFLSRKELSQRFENAGYSISPEEWALLLVLWSKGPQAPSTLSEESIKDRTTVTRLIDGLVKKGFVVRAENPADRRRSDISLTPAGTELKAKLLPIGMEIIEKATAGIPPEDIEITMRTLRLFTDNLTSSNTKHAHKKGDA
ncbi:MAG: MarR family winged helix-turn-helix transcriptional regulator [Thiolinea sp.]